MRLKRKHKKSLGLRIGLILLLIIIIVFGLLSLAEKRAGECAALYAENALRLKLNSEISEILNSGSYRYERFIRLEKNSAGELNAIISDMALINELSGKILQEVQNSGFSAEIPAGSLTGFKFLKGKGPNINLQLKILGSSRVESENSLIKGGENQNCFRIYLEITADTEIIFPRHREYKQFKTNVIIAEALVFPKSHMP